MTCAPPAAAMGAQLLDFIVGFVVARAGIGLRGWTFHTLGQYFTFMVRTSADQPGISSGPYRALAAPPGGARSPASGKLPPSSPAPGAPAIGPGPTPREVPPGRGTPAGHAAAAQRRARARVRWLGSCIFTF